MPTISSLPPVEAAIVYASHGYPVFPCDPQHRPLSLLGLRDATLEPEQVRELWRNNPGSPIGTPTGSPSRLGVVSVNPRVYGLDVLNDLEERHGLLAATATTQGTDGRIQYLYRMPDAPLRGGLNALGTGIDLLAGGGYVVLPSGAWGVVSHRWAQGTILDRRSVAPLPEWIVSHTLPRGFSTSLAEAGPWLTHADHEGFHAAAGDERTMRRFAAKMGIENPNLFRCVLPGHHDTRPSASLCRGRNGLWTYFDHHGNGSLSVETGEGKVRKRSYTLAEAYAYRAVRREWEMSPSEMFVWTARMLIDLDVLVPAPVFLPTLGDAPEAARAVWKGVETLLRCRGLYHAETAFPFARRFGEAWCGLAQHRFNAGLRWLLNAGFLAVVGKDGLTPLYGAFRGSGKPIYAPEDWRKLIAPEGCFALA